MKKKLLYIYVTLYKLSEQLAVQQVTELFTGRVIFKQELQTLLVVMSKCALLQLLQLILLHSQMLLLIHMTFHCRI